MLVYKGDLGEHHDPTIWRYPLLGSYLIQV